MRSPPMGPEAVKAGCAACYGSPALRAVFGDLFHPGGLPFTEALGRRLGLGPDDAVLDVACGAGRSARHLAQCFGCGVTGLDYSVPLVAAARAVAAPGSRFVAGDGERLPFRDGAFTAAVVECALCLFPDKPAAARELHRVLRPAGRVGIADLALERPLPADLPALAGWIGCLGGALPVRGYEDLVRRAGFVEVAIHDYSHGLSGLVDELGRHVFLLEAASALGRLPALPVAPAQARLWLQEARRWIADGAARYVFILARRR